MVVAIVEDCGWLFHAFSMRYLKRLRVKILNVVSFGSTMKNLLGRGKLPRRLLIILKK